MKEYFVYGAIYLRPDIGNENIIKIIESIKEFGNNVKIDYDSQNKSMRLDYCNVDMNINEFESILREIKEQIRGLGVEITIFDLVEHNAETAGETYEMSWMYVLSKEDSRIHKEPGMIMYHHKAFSNKETGLIKIALNEFIKENPEAEPLSEQIMEKIYDMDAMLESYPI